MRLATARATLAILLTGAAQLVVARHQLGDWVIGLGWARVRHVGPTARRVIASAHRRAQIGGPGHYYRPSSHWL